MSISAGNIEPSYKNDPAYRITSIVFPVLVAVVVLLFIWFSRNQVRLNEPRTITLYCFSAMESVMEKSLLPAFQQYWLKEKQEHVEFITTFAGSGVITRQIMTRFPAEVAILSSELDAQRLVGGVITVATWQEIHQHKKFCRSPIVIFVSDSIQRPIHNFEDIDFKTMDVVIPDPLTSGEGQMAVLALYGSRLRQGFSHKQAFEYVKAALTETLNKPSTSQAAIEQFQAGIGDVLFNYEAAVFHNKLNPLKVIHPNRTIMTEPIAVAIQKNITSKQAEIINSFMTFLWSADTQRKLSEAGFQTINTSTQASFGPSSQNDIFTLDSLGTALDLNRSVIDPLAAQ